LRVPLETHAEGHVLDEALRVAGGGGRGGVPPVLRGDVRVVHSLHLCRRHDASCGSPRMRAASAQVATRRPVARTSAAASLTSSSLVGRRGPAWSSRPTRRWPPRSSARRASPEAITSPPSTATDQGRSHPSSMARYNAGHLSAATGDGGDGGVYGGNCSS